MLVVCFVHFSVPPGPVHGVDIGVEEDLVEVPNDDGEGCENGLVEMDGGGGIDPPSSEKIADPDVGPDHDAGNGHESCAPDERPVLGFFGVVEAVELRFDFAESEMEAHGGPDVDGVLWPGRERDEEATAFTLQGEIEDVIDARTDENDSGDTMDDAAQMFAHSEDLSEPRGGVLEREAGDDEDDETGEQNQMLPALLRSHALDEASLRTTDGACFAEPEKDVVEQHSADDEDDERNVDEPNPASGDGSCVILCFAADVDFVQSKALRDAFVALAAGLVEVGVVDG